MEIDLVLEEAAVSYAATGEILDNGKEMIDFKKKSAFKAGAEWQRQQTISKACEWLQRNIDSSMWLGNFRKYLEK